MHLGRSTWLDESDLRQHINLARLWQNKLRQHFAQCAGRTEGCQRRVSHDPHSDVEISDGDLKDCIPSMNDIEKEKAQLKQWQEQMSNFPLVSPRVRNALKRRAKALLWIQRIRLLSVTGMQEADSSNTNKLDNMDFQVLTAMAADIKSIPIGAFFYNETDAEPRSLLGSGSQSTTGAENFGVCQDENQAAAHILSRYNRVMKWIAQVEHFVPISDGAGDAVTADCNRASTTKLEHLANILTDLKVVTTSLPHAAWLQRVVNQAKQWQNKAKLVLAQHDATLIHTKESSIDTLDRISAAIAQITGVISEACSIPVCFDSLPLLRTTLRFWQWRQNARNLMAVSLKRNSVLRTKDSMWPLTLSYNVEDQWSMKAVLSLLHQYSELQTDIISKQQEQPNAQFTPSIENHNPPKLPVEVAEVSSIAKSASELEAHATSILLSVCGIVGAIVNTRKNYVHSEENQTTLLQAQETQLFEVVMDCRQHAVLIKIGTEAEPMILENQLRKLGIIIKGLLWRNKTDLLLQSAQSASSREQKEQLQHAVQAGMILKEHIRATFPSETFHENRQSEQSNELTTKAIHNQTIAIMQSRMNLLVWLQQTTHVTTDYLHGSAIDVTDDTAVAERTMVQNGLQSALAQTTVVKALVNHAEVLLKLAPPSAVSVSLIVQDVMHNLELLKWLLQLALLNSVKHRDRPSDIDTERPPLKQLQSLCKQCDSGILAICVGFNTSSDQVSERNCSTFLVARDHFNMLRQLVRKEYDQIQLLVKTSKGIAKDARATLSEICRSCAMYVSSRTAKPILMQTQKQEIQQQRLQLQELQTKLFSHSILLAEEHQVVRLLQQIQWIETVHAECMALRVPLNRLQKLLVDLPTIDQTTSDVGEDGLFTHPYIDSLQQPLQSLLQAAVRWLKHPLVLHVYESRIASRDSGISSSFVVNERPCTTLAEFHELLAAPVLLDVDMGPLGEICFRQQANELEGWVQDASLCMRDQCGDQLPSTQYLEVVRKLKHRADSLLVTLPLVHEFDVFHRLIQWLVKAESAFIGGCSPRDGQNVHDVKSKMMGLPEASDLLDDGISVVNAALNVCRTGQGDNVSDITINRASRARERLKEEILRCNQWLNRSRRALEVDEGSSTLQELQLEYDLLPFHVDILALLEAQQAWLKEANTVSRSFELDRHTNADMTGELCWGKHKGFPFWPAIFEACDLQTHKENTKKFFSSDTICVLRWIKPIWSADANSKCESSVSSGKVAKGCSLLRACEVESDNCQDCKHEDCFRLFHQVRLWNNGQYPIAHTAHPPFKLFVDAVRAAEAKQRSIQETQRAEREATESRNRKRNSVIKKGKRKRNDDGDEWFRIDDSSDEDLSSDSSEYQSKGKTKSNYSSSDSFSDSSEGSNESSETETSESESEGETLDSSGLKYRRICARQSSHMWPGCSRPAKKRRRSQHYCGRFCEVVGRAQRRLTGLLQWKLQDERQRQSKIEREEWLEKRAQRRLKAAQHRSELLSSQAQKDSSDNLDKLRDIVIKGLAATFDRHLGQTKSKELAQEIEVEMLALFPISAGKKAEYKAKYRSLVPNLKDSKNPELIQKVIQKDICPEELVRMDATELASAELRDWRQQMAEKHLVENVLWGSSPSITPEAATTARSSGDGGAKTKDSAILSAAVSRSSGDGGAKTKESTISSAAVARSSGEGAERVPVTNRKRPLATTLSHRSDGANVSRGKVEPREVSLVEEDVVRSLPKIQHFKEEVTDKPTTSPRKHSERSALVNNDRNPIKSVVWSGFISDSKKSEDKITVQGYTALSANIGTSILNAQVQRKLQQALPQTLQMSRRQKCVNLSASSSGGRKMNSHINECVHTIASRQVFVLELRRSPGDSASTGPYSRFCEQWGRKQRAMCVTVTEQAKRIFTEVYIVPPRECPVTRQRWDWPEIQVLKNCRRDAMHAVLVTRIPQAVVAPAPFPSPSTSAENRDKHRRFDVDSRSHETAFPLQAPNVAPPVPNGNAMATASTPYNNTQHPKPDTWRSRTERKSRQGSVPQSRNHASSSSYNVMRSDRERQNKPVTVQDNAGRSRSREHREHINRRPALSPSRREKDRRDMNPAVGSSSSSRYGSGGSGSSRYSSTRSSPSRADSSHYGSGCGSSVRYEPSSGSAASHGAGNHPQSATELTKEAASSMDKVIGFCMKAMDDPHETVEYRLKVLTTRQIANPKVKFQFMVLGHPLHHEFQRRFLQARRGEEESRKRR